MFLYTFNIYLIYLGWLKTNENKFITASLDGVTILWELDDKNEINKVLNYNDHSVGVISCLTTSKDILITSSVDCKIRFFEVFSGKLLKTINAGPVECWTLSLSIDETLLATGSFTGNINLYETNSVAEKAEQEKSSFVSTVATEASFLLAVSFSPTHIEDRALLVGANKDGKLYWFSYKDTDFKSSLKFLTATKVHEKAIRTVCFSKDSSLLFTGSDDMLVKIFNTSTKQEISCFQGHQSWVLSVVPTIDSDFFVSCSVDKSVKVFERKTGKLRSSVSEHIDEVTQIGFNKTETKLISIGADGNIFIYKYEL